MKDYAMHFAEWIVNNEFVFTHPHKNVWVYNKNVNVLINTEQLYQIYSDEQDLKEKLKYEKDTN